VKWYFALIPNDANFWYNSILNTSLKEDDAQKLIYIWLRLNLIYLEYFILMIATTSICDDTGKYEQCQSQSKAPVCFSVKHFLEKVIIFCCCFATLKVV
jgi:hypothetical protein